MPSKLRILDIDTECLPGHWIGGDYVSKIITAVAWSWIGEKGGVKVLTHYRLSPPELAVKISEVIEEADIVTGHYIRGFDLPLINGNLLIANVKPLSHVMAHDTKLDLIKAGGRSLSQQNLSAEIGVSKPKVFVSVPDWEKFNLRLKDFEEKGIERVKGDVLQNIEMRAKLIELGWLGRPKAWESTNDVKTEYVP